MSVIVKSGATSDLLTVEASTKAARVTPRPIDYGALGIYSLSVQTGTMAAGLAADAEIFQFRWTDASKLAIVYRVVCEGAGGITAFTAGFTKMQAFIARSFTVAGTGGATATLTGNNQKLRTSMGTSLVNEIRIATTAALTTGTKTLDGQGIGGIIGSTTATAGAVLIPPGYLFDSNTMLVQPVVLAQNEGVVVRVTVPATGTWTGGVTITWAELTAY